jgi:hypothetical protein
MIMKPVSRATTAPDAERGVSVPMPGLPGDGTVLGLQAPLQHRPDHLAEHAGLPPSRRQRPAVLGSARGFMPRLRERARGPTAGYCSAHFSASAQAGGSPVPAGRP